MSSSSQAFREFETEGRAEVGQARVPNPQIAGATADLDMLANWTRELALAPTDADDSFEAVSVGGAVYVIPIQRKLINNKLEPTVRPPPRGFDEALRMVDGLADHIRRFALQRRTLVEDIRSRDRRIRELEEAGASERALHAAEKLELIREKNVLMEALARVESELAAVKK